MDKSYIAQQLRGIFTEREILVLQLKMYNVVSIQPGNMYTENNVILEKLGGEPILTDRENIYD